MGHFYLVRSRLDRVAPMHPDRAPPHKRQGDPDRVMSLIRQCPHAMLLLRSFPYRVQRPDHARSCGSCHRRHCPVDHLHRPLEPTTTYLSPPPERRENAMHAISSQPSTKGKIFSFPILCSPRRLMPLTASTIHTVVPLPQAIALAAL
jgi:hypothetical protein